MISTLLSRLGPAQSLCCAALSVPAWRLSFFFKVVGGGVGWEGNWNLLRGASLELIAAQICAFLLPRDCWSRSAVRLTWTSVSSLFNKIGANSQRLLRPTTLLWPRRLLGGVWGVALVQ